MQALGLLQRQAAKAITGAPASWRSAASFAGSIGAKSLQVVGYSAAGVATAGAGFAAASYVAASAVCDSLPETREYHWVSPEAEGIIAKAYARHQRLADPNRILPVARVPQENTELRRLDTQASETHYDPQDFGDWMAYNLMRSMRVFTHLFFREKYDHHACVLETVAAVPGVVAAASRHLRSLRNMEHDHGWINPLQEEAENERMHLLIWMCVTNPTWAERQLVTLAQGAYLLFYSSVYLVNSKLAHRLVGYLEEEAVAAYTDYVNALQPGGHLESHNKQAPKIARQYYGLPDSATVLDVALRVRADECMHRDFNHMLGERISAGKTSEPPVHPGQHATKDGKGGPNRWHVHATHSSKWA